MATSTRRHFLTSSTMETPSYDIQTPGVYETAPLLPDIAANAEAPKIRSGRRLGSLDALRGFTVSPSPVVFGPIRAPHTIPSCIA